MVSPTEVNTTTCNQGEVIMTTQTEQGSVGLQALAHDECGNVRVNVFFPDYNIQVRETNSHSPLAVYLFTNFTSIVLYFYPFLNNNTS